MLLLPIVNKVRYRLTHMEFDTKRDVSSLNGEVSCLCITYYIMLFLFLTL